MDECEGGDEWSYIVFDFMVLGLLSSEVVELFSTILTLYDWFFWQAFVPSILICLRVN
jgi:hypothetical protein